MKSYSATPKDVKDQWWIIDAEGVVLGRLASQAALILRGKHKPMFTPHIDCGDHVVVINADKIKITGKKLENKKFFWHTGFPGGIKETTPIKTLRGKFPQRVVERAILRMLPEGPLGTKQYKKLRVYAGTEHPHTAQQPQTLDLAKKNAKNKR
ncbi:MAG: 50S ribosomal protein L13 [Rickettsiales bacterium]